MVLVTGTILDGLFLGCSTSPCEVEEFDFSLSPCSTVFFPLRMVTALQSLGLILVLEGSAPGVDGPNS